MKVHYCDQGSPEWHQARAGVITASMFRVARSRVGGLNEQQQAYVDAIRAGNSEAAARTLAGYKTAPRAEAIEKSLAGLPVGDWSDPAKNYAFRLAVERISGEPDGRQVRNLRDAPRARTGARGPPGARGPARVIVERCGFITTDDGKFGCSTDGLINPSAISEYKCLLAPDGLRRMLIAGDLSDFTDQTHGGLWITGRRRIPLRPLLPGPAPIGRHFTLHDREARRRLHRGARARPPEVRRAGLRVRGTAARRRRRERRPAAQAA
jgi:hypothetical protein